MDEDEIETWYTEECAKRFESYKQLISELGESRAYEWYRAELAKIREKYLALYDEMIQGKKKEGFKEKYLKIQDKVKKKVAEELKRASDYAAKLKEANPEKEIFRAQKQSQKEIKSLRSYIKYRNFILKYKLDYPMYVVKRFFISLYQGTINWFGDIKKWFLEVIDRILNYFKELYLKVSAKIKAIFDRIMKWVSAIKGFFVKVYEWVKERIYKLKDLFKKKQEPTQQPVTQQPQAAQVQSQPVSNPSQNVQSSGAGTSGQVQNAPVGNEKKGGEQPMEENKKGFFSKLLNLFKPKRQEPMAQMKPQQPAVTQPQPSPLQPPTDAAKQAQQPPVQQAQPPAQSNPAAQQPAKPEQPQAEKKEETKEMPEKPAKKKAPAKKAKKAPSRKK